MEPVPVNSPETRDRFAQAVHDTVMPMIVSLGLGEYWQRCQQLLEADRLPADQLRRQQWDRFKTLLAHAHDTVPLYRETMQAAGVTPDDIAAPEDLPRLPTVTKPEIEAGFPDRITSAKSDRGQWCMHSTSGTTDRLMTISDWSARQWRYALHLRSMKIAGDYQVGQVQVSIRTAACSDACGGGSEPETSTTIRTEREWPPYGLAQLTLQETKLPPFNGRGTLVDPDELDRYLQEIESRQPYLLRGLPIYLLLLARRIRDSRTRPPPVRRIVVQDSLAPTEMKQEIAEAFGCEVRETYGSSELGSVAAECEAGWLHVASDLFVVEVLRSDGTAAPPGETGRVVISSMANQTMPLIRFRLGDVGHLAPGECRCGRSTPRLRVDGREKETLVFGGKLVTARQIYTAVSGSRAADFFQCVQRGPGQLEVQLVPASDGALNVDRCLASVRTLVDDDIDLRAREVKAIWPESSGKFVFVHGSPEATDSARA
jgi:phenylacetate-CoA ligase